MMIHPLADVKSQQIGKDTKVWQYAIIMDEVTIGDNCNINCHTFIENGVSLGNNVTVKSGVYLWTGIQIADDVFIGPNVTFTNDKYPRSKQYSDKYQDTIIHRKVSIGAAATVLGGLIIGEYSMVAAGALVTKNVPARALVVGSPAKIVSWLNEDGSKMIVEGDRYIDNNNQQWKVLNDELRLI